MSVKLKKDPLTAKNQVKCVKRLDKKKNNIEMFIVSKTKSSEISHNSLSIVNYCYAFDAVAVSISPTLELIIWRIVLA
jgi:hypothetical protein